MIMISFSSHNTSAYPFSRQLVSQSIMKFYPTWNIRDGLNIIIYIFIFVLINSTSKFGIPGPETSSGMSRNPMVGVAVVYEVDVVVGPDGGEEGLTSKTEFISNFYKATPGSIFKRKYISDFVKCSQIKEFP